jgi:hypothetical protein
MTVPGEVSNLAGMQILLIKTQPKLLRVMVFLENVNAVDRWKEVTQPLIMVKAQVLCHLTKY